MIQYEIRLLDWWGRPIRQGIFSPEKVDGQSLSLTIGLGLVGTGVTGVCEIGLPSIDLLNSLRKDYRIAVYRSVDGGPEQLEGNAEFLIRYRQITPNGGRIRGVHVNTLLDQRFILYGPGKSFTQKTGPAGDVIKAFVRENLGNAVGSSRDGVETGVDLSQVLSIGNNNGLGPTISISRSRKRLSEVIRDICELSRSLGHYLIAEVYSSGGKLIFDVFSPQRGVDRRGSLVFSPALGNITNSSLTIDETEEVTFVAVGGAGEQDLRIIGTAIDLQRVERSPFGRSEVFVNDTDITTQSGADNRAQSILSQGRPRITYTGEIVSVPGCVRGRDFNYGDFVRIEDFGKTFYARLHTLSVLITDGEVSDKIQVKVDV